MPEQVGGKKKPDTGGAAPVAPTGIVEYSEVIDSRGIKVPFVPAIITPKIERPLRSGRYEGGERAALRALLRPGDRVLEFGAGLGLLSTAAALVPGVESVTTIEANPALLPLIRETHRLNAVPEVDLRNGVVSADDGPPLPFYLRPDFWASSMGVAPNNWTEAVEVPRAAIGDLLEELRPTVLVCDIEGGELGLLDNADLGSVRAIVMEFHPKLYGAATEARLQALITAKGFRYAPSNVATSTVKYFERDARPEPGSTLPPRSFRPWPITAPRTLIATCMKDEGPFILEWLAWHKSVGVTDFVVFTNDCTDGTDRLLDRLQDLGELIHLPNPAIATGETAFQPIALNYAHRLRAMREADFFISMDVDEFLNIRVGDGMLTDLFGAVGAFDVLSVSEVNHGANGQKGYERDWLLDLFPMHQSMRPGKMKSRRGVKSIVRLSDKVERLRNHRPDMFADHGPVRWLDGSGRDQKTLAADRNENGLDCRGTYDLVRLEHFALRSLDSYLAKMYRGDVVVAKKQVSRAYWRQRNKNEEASGDYGLRLARARAYHRDRYEGDPALMDLHEACCRAHAARIEQLLQKKEFIERRNWILAEAWP